MEIRYHKRFREQYRGLTTKRKDIIDKAILLFKKKPKDKLLYNHPLKGRLKGLRSFHASGDLCVVFEESGNYTDVLFLKVGSHNQLRFNT